MSEIMLAYLKKRVESNQGIKIALLPGHLAQLPGDVRSKYGATGPAIRSFMEKHPEVFIIDNSGRVFTRPQRNKDLLTATTATDEASASNDVTALIDVKGKVLRVFNVFGFISVTHPFKTTVYFTVKNFEEGKYANLLTCGLAEGDCVIFDAAKSVGHKAAFKATCVRRIDSHAVDSDSKSRVGNGQLGDGDDRLKEQLGVIHTVKQGYGFIVFGPKKKNCAFFHGSTVDKAVAKNSRNLAEFFTVGDNVYFDAKPDDKDNKWVKWKATRVWRAATHVNSACDSDIDSGEEVFMSEDEDDIQGFLNNESEQESSDVDVEDYPVGCPDWEDTPRTSSHQHDEPCGAKPLLEWPARKKLSGMKGMFVPYTDKNGLVFWLEKGIRVHVVITTVYHMGRQIKSFSELCQDSSEQGVEVFFDAVEGDDMWVATLAWTGERPAKLHVNHSEHIFNSVLALVRAGPSMCEHSDRDAAHPLSVPSEEEPSVTIFPNGKGVVRKVLPRAAVCNVQDPDGDRQLEFTHFYKDGLLHVEHLEKILQTGDAVSVDYMVGRSFGEEYVYCGTVWQGRKPTDAAQLSPEDFMKLISTRPAQHSATLSASSQGQPSSSMPVIPPAKQENGLRLPLDKSSLDKLPGGAPATGVTAQMQSGVRSLNGSAVQSKKKHGAVPAPSAEASVSVYPNAKGTIAQVLDCIAMVQVKEVETMREIEFSIDCFFKDGVIGMDDLNEVLGVGDEVYLDYMVGNTGHKEVIHCDLIWQGKRPRNVCCLSPDDFAKKLGIAQPSAGVTVSVDDLCSGWLQESPQKNNLAAQEQQQLVGKVKKDELEANSSFPEQSSKQTMENAEQPPVPADLTGSPHHIAPSIDNETLLRLIRTVVEEYQARLREELQKCMEAFMEHPKVVVGCDAETQTSREDSAVVSSSCGDATPLFFSPCGSPSRELDPLHTSPPPAGSSLLQPGVMQFGAFHLVEASSALPAENISLYLDGASDVPVADCISQLPALPGSESVLDSDKASEAASAVSQPAETSGMQVRKVENLAADSAAQATELSHRRFTQSEAPPCFEPTSKGPTCAQVSQSELAASDMFIEQAVDSRVPVNNKSVLELFAPLHTESNCDISDECCHDWDTVQPSEALHTPECEIAAVSVDGSLEAERTSDGLSTGKSMSSLFEEPDNVPVGAITSQPVKSKNLIVEHRTGSRPPSALDAACAASESTDLHLVEDSGTVQPGKGSLRLCDNCITEPLGMLHAPDCRIVPLSGDAVFEAEETLNKPLPEGTPLLSDALDSATVTASVLQPAESGITVIDSNSACSQLGASTLDTVCGGTSTHLVEAAGTVGAGEDALQSVDIVVIPEIDTLHTADSTQDSQTEVASREANLL